ncbi:MAG: GWxTD domain-containing protein [Gemmatimonadetes bacterium]|nr:GWxTD domain-containing protein [Gemmatimonadota bacterium]
MARPSRCAILLPLLLLLLAGRSGAQGPAGRRELAALRDSLARVADSVSLLALEGQWMGEARRDRDSAMVHLRLGFVAVRLGELGGKKHYDDAASEFQWATTLQPTWPYGWFGLGLAELGVGDSDFSPVAGLKTMLGKDALTRSANAFARSAEVDPSFVIGLVELSNTALRQIVNARMDVALAALRRASRTPAARHPDVLLARARVEREVGSADSALAAADALLALDRINVEGLLEQARARFALGRLDGGEPWYRGLGLAEGPVLAMYRRDLALVMPATTLAAFDAAAPTARVTLVRAFFERRDHDELQRVGGRLREHYARLDHAQRNFRLVSRRRQYDIQERYRSTQDDFDDRGVIYVRHGAPDQRVQYNVPGIEPNESWRYQRVTGDLVFHFVARQDVQDFRLVESVLDILGFAGAMAARDSGQLSSSGQAEALVRSREPLGALYSRMLGAARGGGTMLQTEERAIGRKSIAIGTRTDSWPLRFRRTLDATIFVAAAGADSAGPQLQIAFAVPTKGLTIEVGQGGDMAELRLRATVLDLDGALVASLDTVRRFLMKEPAGADGQLLGRQALRVPAGRLTVRASLEQGPAGIGSRRDTVVVTSPTARALGLSDLVVGTRSVRLFWVPSTGDTTWLNPLARFRRSEPMQLSFEVSGLLAGSAYRTEVRIVRPGGSALSRLFRGGSALRVAANGVHPGGLLVVHRELALDQVGPGTYLVEVTVSTPAGEKVTRQQEITVVK